ncbi:MAG: hypothetical protein OXF44_09620 [Anaerolineaceae bacterium]|nr:hypothetical protein [Anaerolineaceae bacterium]
MPEAIARRPHRPLFWPETVSQLQAIVAEFDQPVFLVGGAVRDALAGRPVHDIDLALADGGVRASRRIANALGGHCYVLDRKRDVGRALLDVGQAQIRIDVARFRGPDLHADLLDRDFTINAMAVELAGNCDLLIDPLDGEVDLKARRLRQCHGDSLANDPLRAMRALRLAAQFGFQIERNTLNSMRPLRERLVTCSAERIRDEFWRLLELPQASAAIRAAAATGVLDVLMPELAGLRHRPASGEDYGDGWQECLAILERLQHVVSAFTGRLGDGHGASFGAGMLVMQLNRWRAALQQHLQTTWPDQRAHRALLVLGGLYSVQGRADVNAAQAVVRAKAFCLSNAECDRLERMLRWRDEVLSLDAGSDLSLHRFWRGAGDAGVDACLLAAAGYLGRTGSRLDHEEWLNRVGRIARILQARFEQMDSLINPPPLLDGHGLMRELSLSPGPLVGDVLDHIREAQVSGTVGTKEEALALARNLLAADIG